jgi:RND family efflux transporter MFP subunit
MNRVSLFLTATALLLANMGCSSQKPAASAAPEIARNIAIVQASASSIPDALIAVGTVRAAETSQISAQMMGNVLAVNVREGDMVKQGQVLVTIDPAQAQAMLERSQAALNAAQHEVAAAQSQKTLADSTLQRYDTLFQRKSVSPQEFDEVKARAQSAGAAVEAAQAGQAQAKAAVAQAQSAFGYTRLRAPFDGFVTERRVDPGALASPGMPLLTLESTGRLRLEASVDETDLRFVRIGDGIPVTLDAYPDQKLSGRVSQIVPAADPGSRSFLVKIELPSSSTIRSGLFGRAQFSRGERNALVIPQTAVVAHGSLKGVFVIGQDKVASLRYVTLGNSVHDQVEVLSGLAANESIVLAPADRELGGKRIEVQ